LNTGSSVEALMLAADSAMYEAKRRGKGQYRFHEAE
jgi:GGDEF domain-containing protein